MKRTAILHAALAAVLLAPVGACNKGPKDITELEAEHGGSKPAYKDLAAVDPRITDIVDNSRDAQDATSSVLAYVNRRLDQADDSAVRAYGQLMLKRLAAAKFAHPQECQAVLHGVAASIDEVADPAAEHRWLMETIHPAHPETAIHSVVFGPTIPTIDAIHPKPGDTPCDTARETVEAALKAPGGRDVAALRTLGIGVGASALGS